MDKGMQVRRRRPRASSPALEPGRLQEEIAILERRLAQIGPDGDCGYEKALIRFFEQQLVERRDLLRKAVSGSTIG